MQEKMTMLTPSYPATEPPNDYTQQPDQAQLEADKRAVYKHPLFPLLALLFERCEQATQSAESPNSESFNMDIQAFVQHQERDRKPFLLNDPEVDGLMIKAIQVLRIHLLELEKVQELCKDFCNRYITCLKGKMQSENLLRSDYNNYENNNNNNNSSDSNSPVGNYGTSPHSLQVGSLSGTQNSSPSSSPGLTTSNASTPFEYLNSHHPSNHLPVNQYQFMQQGNTSLSSVNHQNPPSSPGIVHGSTPLSQIGANPCPPPSENSLLAAGQLSPSPTTPGSMDEEDDFLGGKGKKQKRGVLPKHATSVMRSWLFQHLVHPYPTEDEKRQIASQTNLTLLQVNNWFINARRRILQPMLDASNPSEGSTSNGGKSKKPKNSGSSSSKQAAQRFWPENLAHLQPQLTESNFGGSSEEEGSDDDSEEDGLVINDDEDVAGRNNVKNENYSSDSESNNAP
ncbi:Homeobox protein PKNOX2, putative [Pediculus humanus corporis]|uniref:Homeobox protein PKNOX2, putative n=1 Tax=Pediculus humanus subsp. corporis TaxID=121224 RepID=E0W144_PEDHC|nr:Homeobox protein PKNOX2, putative [Pediculus humanus corporis]EEB19350.1 Homeobox protein PKNOX2, putative [Pediculus humanus corporis]